MSIYQNYTLILLLLGIVCYSAAADTTDICESCKHIDECPKYGEMTREQQQQWIQDYPCEGPKVNVEIPYSGFSPTAKGDYVCCPSVKVWGISEDKQDSQDGKTVPNSYNVPNYLWYNQNQPSGNGDIQQPRLMKNSPTGLNNYNNINGFGQCPIQSAPPNPDSGCCGVDLSDSDRITDLQKFLQSRAPSSNWGSQTNYPRYPREIYRRATDTDALGVTFENRIAGGREADLDQYPWTVYLAISFISRNTRKGFACGGSLISSRYVLTAAHCLTADDGQLDQVDVILAEYDRRTFPRDCITVRGRSPICVDNVKVSASDAFIHPNFIEQSLENDIALLRLKENVPQTRYIRPICLPPINIDSPQFANLPLATAGWGLNVSVESNIKQHTVLHMVPKSECKPHYSRLTEGHLCASGKTSEDTCKGDSGGPLMMMYQGKYYVVGIVSGKTAAYPCGTPVPSLYANVYHYLDWIRNYVR